MAGVMFVGQISIDGGPPRPFTATGVTSPLGFWGGSPPPYPDQGLPPSGVGIWPSPGHPDQGLPPSGVGVWPSPGRPAHPIVIVPPGAIDGTHPEHPIYLPVYPAHPIELPPTEPPPSAEFVWVYTDQFGWVLDPVQSGGKPVPVP
jgi:hypothetical protein